MQRFVSMVLGSALGATVVIAVLDQSPQIVSQAYGLTAMDEAKPPFAMRRMQRSWIEDTADWKDGVGQAIPGLRRDPLPPLTSTIGPLKSSGISQYGSAVAIGDTGESSLWLTARHMVADCISIRIAGNGLLGASSLLAAFPLSLHPTVDLALIETASSHGKYAAVAVERPAISNEAIHIGFPGGRPAAIYSDYIGITRVRWVDNSLPAEAYRVWAERTQVPDDIVALGGLSGGATLDRDGAVIGTVVGVSERRGRILSTRPAQIAHLMRQHAFMIGEASQHRMFDEHSYPVFARQLVEQRQVARLNCERSPNKKRAPRGMAPSG